MIQPIPYIGEPATLPIVQVRTKTQIRTRNGFDEQSLSELASSIREVGIIEPLIVRPCSDGHGYEVIAGERRLLAASMAELTEVPVIIRDADDAAAAVIQAIENLQREQLTLADTCDGVLSLMTHYGKAGAVAKALGKSPSWVSKHIGLAKAHPDVRALMSEGLTDDAELLGTLAQIRKHKDGMIAFNRLAKGLETRDTTRAIARKTLDDLKAPAAAIAPNNNDEDTGDEGTANGMPRLFHDLTIALTSDQLEKLQSLGGAKWLIEQLDAA